MAAATAPLVRIETVTKRFDTATAVDGVSLDIARGELFALLGGSGCGKTTLLRMLAGFERPDGGRILLDGADMADVPPYARPVNMMFQSYALFPHMTVAQNVAFGLRQDKVPADARRRRVAEALALVELVGLDGRKPHQLSGGQRQRVALARSLVKRPKLLLLDEPLAALDKRLREQTQLELVRIQRQVGITFVMVTHDQDEAMSMATRIGVMDAGRIVQVGTPGEIYEAPATRFVASFVGSINLFDVRVATLRPGHALLACDAAAAELAAAPVAGLTPGASVTLAVRPEKLVLSHAATADMENRLTGVVQDVAYQGGQSRYHVRLASGKTVQITAANVTREAAQRMAIGDAVHLSWRAEDGVVLTS